MVESFLSEVSGFSHNKGIHFIEFFPHNFMKRFSMTNFHSTLKPISIWANGLVVKALDSQSKVPTFKTTEWLQGRLSLSSFRGR